TPAATKKHRWRFSTAARHSSIDVRLPHQETLMRIRFAGLITIAMPFLVFIAGGRLSAQVDTLLSSAERDFKSGNYIKAESGYATAYNQALNRLGNEPERAQIAVRRAEVLVIMGRFKEAQQRIPASLPDPATALAADLVRAQSEAGLGHYASA